MSRDLYFVKVAGHAMNVGDISIIAPAREDQMRPTAESPADGVRVTFRSKGNSVYLPGMDPEGFMDAIAAAVNLALPD